MERDSLLAHGAAYLLHDRLHACSDYSVMDVCAQCGSLLAPLNMPHAAAGATQVRAAMPGSGMRGCGGFEGVCAQCGSAQHASRGSRRDTGTTVEGVEGRGEEEGRGDAYQVLCFTSAPFHDCMPR